MQQVLRAGYRHAREDLDGKVLNKAGALSDGDQASEQLLTTRQTEASLFGP